ncbi:uncharacterized protein Pyn_10504 [Prunus yedoensis var. nudiflora]|uniref:Uncharacterized protein n=4 Tax=Prunus TaxID=3754 RepID=A0A314URC3_PRUYE|nr:PREDICTED: uncharacterized protein LOC103321842 [Prunus mume]KAH0991730.1 hypothetical protein GBA52_003213 [Prunus armeniaca]ONI30340.1 hypothetical protein PRUPE_1G245600 [Prunus persica]PQM39981.1 uncharacterized protein Pyn_12299 [Prunus yedoensis var. nudiflora]PQP97657.1 uncharacterized protein Pyn_10504 [Prunus yedoensis var. nudiflora]CAB4264294.1 unnamed protein product [Prunus armeniaca]
MESDEQVSKKDIKVEIPADETEKYVCAGLSRQLSMTKNNCLCSPTTHAGSFRCRLHRAPSLQRTKSMDCRGPASKAG